jgi:hypothetical protein
MFLKQITKPKMNQKNYRNGLDNIKAKLQTTSESWIASTILVTSIVNLTRLTAYCLNYLYPQSLIRFFGRKKWSRVFEQTLISELQYFTTF